MPVVRYQEAELPASTIAVYVFLEESLTKRGMDLIVLRHDREVAFNASPFGKFKSRPMRRPKARGFASSTWRTLRDPNADVITMKISKFTVKERIKRNPNLWIRVQREVRDLICGTSKKYTDLRRRFAQLSNKSQTAIVSVIAATIGANLGVAAGILVPLIALAIAAFLAVGKNAYCSGETTPKKRIRKQSAAA